MPPLQLGWLGRQPDVIVLRVGKQLPGHAVGPDCDLDGTLAALDRFEIVEEPTAVVDHSPLRPPHPALPS
jgi:hypothetical protein